MSDDGFEPTTVAAPTDLKRKAEAHLDLSDDKLDVLEAMAAAYEAEYAANRKSAAEAVDRVFEAFMRGGAAAGQTVERLVSAFRDAGSTAAGYGDEASTAIAHSFLEFQATTGMSRAAVYAVNLHVDMLTRAIEEDWRSAEDPRAQEAMADLSAAIAKARASG